MLTALDLKNEDIYIIAAILGGLLLFILSYFAGLKLWGKIFPDGIKKKKSLPNFGYDVDPPPQKKERKK